MSSLQSIFIENKLFPGSNLPASDWISFAQIDEQVSFEYLV